MPSTTLRCSSYWKGSLLLALDYGRQLYLYQNIYFYQSISISSCAIVFTFWLMPIGKGMNLFIPQRFLDNTTTFFLQGGLWHLITQDFDMPLPTTTTNNTHTHTHTHTLSLSLYIYIYIYMYIYFFCLETPNDGLGKVWKRSRQFWEIYLPLPPWN